VHLNLKTLLVIVLVIFWLACGKQQASRDDVRSDLVKSISMASEAETFVRYIGQGRSMHYFASGHLHYLLDEVNRSAQELSNLNASPDLKNVLNVERVQLSRLAVQIQNVQQHLQEPNVLAASEQQIREIRMTLVQAKSSI
jgi:hypothetical protein